MEIVLNLTSGLMGALVGAAVAAFAAWKLQTSQLRRDEQAAGRLVHLELVRNVVVLGQAPERDVLRLLTSTTWESERTKLVSLLGAEKLALVSLPYLRLSAHWAGPVRLKIGGGRPVFFRELERDFPRARDVLAEVVLKGDERDSIRAAIASAESEPPPS